MRDTILATIRYARGDGEKLQTEKPYILTYPTAEGIPWANFVIDFHPGTKIHSLRTAPQLDYHKCGIAVGTLASCMPKEDFDDESKIKDVYLPQVHRCLRQTLGATEIYIFDYVCVHHHHHHLTAFSAIGWDHLLTTDCPNFFNWRVYR
jgi:hypothetical protein